MDYKTSGDYAHAIEQFSLALKQSPNDPTLLNTRAMTYMVTGQYDSALKDLDEAVKLNPVHSLAIKNRGRAHFYLGQFAEAATDLRKGAALDPGNLYVPIWLDLALLRQGQDGSEELAAAMARVDSTEWPMPIALFLTGKFTVRQLDLAAASAPGGPREKLCTMFYVGVLGLTRRDSALARASFAEARDKCPKTATEYHAAGGELTRLTR